MSLFNSNEEYKIKKLETSLADITSRRIYVNIKEYGAKGDGVTDDTTAFNNCFANSTNRYIYIPSGTYRVRYTNFSKGIYLLGDGFDKTIIKRVDNYTTDNFDNAHSEKSNLLGNANTSLTTMESVSIEGICFDGNISSVTSTQALAQMFNNVQFTYLNNLFVKNCKFINSIGDGLWFSGVRNAIIDSCFFDHCGYNTAPGTNTKNSMTTLGSYWNGTTYVVETNTTIRNCYFKDAHDMGVVTRNPKSLTIENCEFVNMGDSDLELYGDSLTGSTIYNTFDTKMVIKNNVFTGKIGHGDSNKNYKEVFIFENNIVEDNAGQFFISGNGTDFVVYVKNNKFITNQVQFVNVKRVFLQNNDIQFSGVTGVFFNICQYPIISENNIYYTGTDTANTLALVLYDLSTEPSIINNIFSSNVKFYVLVTLNKISVLS
jgi:hypothetical protein